MPQPDSTPSQSIRTHTSRLLSEYSMFIVLVLLAAYYSWATLADQDTSGAEAAAQLSARIAKTYGKQARVLIAVRDIDTEFANELARHCKEDGLNCVGTITGEPRDARKLLEELSKTPGGVDVIACNHNSANWNVFAPEYLATNFPSLAKARVVEPQSYRWPNFLRRDNLLNIASQISVIAILAIGMTLVIITGGIDLSVGKLIAFAAVVTAMIVRDHNGLQASVATMILASVVGILACAAVGVFTGTMVAVCSIPSFIVTLSIMLMADGFSFMLAHNEANYDIPESYIWLGRGSSAGIPNAVLLMLLLYFMAHVLMNHTVLGRYIYAVGGNAEAARISAVPVKWVLIFVYALCGATAGLGGIVMTSQLKSGSPNYGLMYELYTIAAVVVGGASLSGGEGKIFGTLIGAFIIAVIQNGMNLTNQSPNMQKVVFGAIILGAALFDTLKRRGWTFAK